MPMAVLQNGEIRPLEPLPANWQEGQRLRVESLDEGEPTPEQIDRDFALLASLCSDSDPADEERLSQALHEGVPLQLLERRRQGERPVGALPGRRSRKVRALFDQPGVLQAGDHQGRIGSGEGAIGRRDHL